MTEDEVLKSAYAMPLTSPAYPKPPFRFVNREFVIVTYRTDPHKLREVVPEPAPGARTSGEVRVHSHAGLNGFRRLHRKRTSHPRLVAGPQGQLQPLHVS